MGTKLLVKLYEEIECYECSGKGNKGEIINTKGKTVKIDCLKCKNTGKLWARLAYTHTYSYEEALKILIPRALRQYPTRLSCDKKYWLVWEKKALTAPIDVSKAVAYRIKKRDERLNKKVDRR